jgi:hypothetical protein
MDLDVPRMLVCCAAFGDVDGSQEHKLRLEGLSRWLPSRDSFLFSPVKPSVLVRRHPQIVHPKRSTRNRSQTSRDLASLADSRPNTPGTINLVLAIRSNQFE